MDSSSAITSAISQITPTGGLTSQIAVSVVAQSESAEKAQITTLFSSLGVGGKFSAVA